MAESQLNMGRRVSIDMESGQVIGTRKLRGSGNSTVLSIPPQILDVADLKAGDEVSITADMDSGEITITPKADGEEADGEN